MKLRDIATALNARLEGDGNLDITGVNGIEEAEPGQVTFVSNPKYAAAAKTTRASAVIVDDAFLRLRRQRCGQRIHIWHSLMPLICSIRLRATRLGCIRLRS